jgi:hypothetical protein
VSFAKLFGVFFSTLFEVDVRLTGRSFRHEQNLPRHTQQKQVYPIAN